MPPRANNNNNTNAGGATNNANNNIMVTGIAPSTIQIGYFQGSPITKLGVMVWVLCQFVFKQSSSSKPSSTTSSSINYYNNSSNNNNKGQIFLATMFLIPNLRKLERELGSMKFICWICMTLLFSLLMMDVMKIIIGDYYFYELFFGPSNNNNQQNNNNNNYNNNENVIQFLLSTLRNSYHPILTGGVLYWYYTFVPRLYPRFVSILGTPFSEKSLYGIWGIYVLMSGGMFSVVSSLFGAISSLMFLSTNLGKFIDIPDWIVSSNNNTIFESLGGLFLLDPPTKIYAPLMMNMPTTTRGGGGSNRNNHRGNTAAAAAAAMAGGGGGGRGRATPVRSRAAVPSPPQPPPQAAIDQLTAMGFDEQQVRQALQQSGNNVERAADRLLSG